MDYDSKSGLYFLYALCLVTITGSFFLYHTSWFLPLTLLVWGFLGLSRIIVLTTPFDGFAGHSLSRKILRSLGFFKQLHKDAILSSAFCNHIVASVFFLMVVCFVVIGFNPTLPATEFIFVTDSPPSLLDPVAQSYHFFVMDALYTPFLIGIASIILLTYPSVQRDAYIFIGCLFGFCAVMLIASFFDPDQHSTISPFIDRAQKGGFILASLPYILAIYAMFSPLLFADLKNSSVYIRMGYALFLGVAMAGYDLYGNLGPSAQVFVTAFWFQLAVLSAPMLYQWRYDLTHYHKFRKTLDFRTKEEHI